jgi:hypothetical protein
MAKTKTGVYLTADNAAFLAAHAHGKPTALINAALDFYREHLPDKDILTAAIALYHEQRGRRDALVEAVERIARAIEEGSGQKSVRPQGDEGGYMLEVRSYYRAYCICGATEDWGINHPRATEEEARTVFILRGWHLGETFGETRCPACASGPTPLASDTEDGAPEPVRWAAN